VPVLAKRHQKVKRQRTDFHYTTALDLVRAYDTIYLEDLQVANMRKRPAPTAKLRKVRLAGSKSALSDAASGAPRLPNLLQICSRFSTGFHAASRK
jgi:transposase